MAFKQSFNFQHLIFCEVKLEELGGICYFLKKFPQNPYSRHQPQLADEFEWCLFSQIGGG